LARGAAIVAAVVTILSVIWAQYEGSDATDTKAARAQRAIGTLITPGHHEIKPPPRISGTSGPKFPNRCISAHIAAYSSLGPSNAPLRNPCKPPHSRRAAFGVRPNCHTEGNWFELMIQAM